MSDQVEAVTRADMLQAEHEEMLSSPRPWARSAAEAYAAGWRACQEQMARYATEMWLEARGPTHYYAGSVQERIRAAQLAEARAAEAKPDPVDPGGEV